MKGSPMLVHVALLAGCGGSQSVPAASEQVAGPDLRVEDMHAHFEDINAIQRALIAGDVAAARAHAEHFIAGFSGTTPEGWTPFVERAVASAEMMKVSTDLAMSAQLAGTMAGTCGDCHRAHELSVISLDDSSPESTDTMLRHRWATDRLWEGIIGPSEDAWRAGAALLASEAMAPETVEGAIEVTPQIVALIDNLSEQASLAHATADPEERKVIYGRLLSSCAGCHHTMRRE